MRIIPGELLKYTPNNVLQALRKEFFMYDHALNIKKINSAMQPFLNLGRPYFNCLMIKGVDEMKKRHLYINSFMTHYAQTHQPNHMIKTDIGLIIECILQGDLKKFIPYNTTKSGFVIGEEIIKQQQKQNIAGQITKYHTSKHGYQENYMKLNYNQELKPYKLDMEKMIGYLKQQLTI